MSLARRLLPLTVVAVVAATGVPAAWSQGTVTAPAAPVTSHGVVALTGEVDATERDRLELRLAAPEGQHQVVAELGAAALTDRDRALRADLDTGACSLPPVCAGGGTASNGVWSVQLVALTAGLEQERLLASADLVLDVPARAPSGVRAVVTAPREVTVSWERGTEPDVQHWVVGDGAGVEQVVRPGDGVCRDGACGTVVSYPAQASGKRTISVAAARRCAAPGCLPTRSAATAADPVSLPAAPASAPAGPSAPAAEPAGPSAPGAGPAGPAAPRAEPTGPPAPVAEPAAPSAGAGPAQPSAHTPPGDGPGGAGTTPLGQRPGDTSPQLGAPARLGAASLAAPALSDTFEAALGYPERTETVPEPIIGGRPTGNVLTSTGGSLGEDGVLRHEGLVTGAAAALVLLMTGAHLRMWARSGARNVPGG